MRTTDWAKTWKVVELGELCDVQIGGTPSRKQPEYWGGPNLWTSISDLDSEVVTETKEHITDLGIVNSNVKLVKAGTLLMSFKLTIGKLAFASLGLYTNEAIVALPIRDHTILDKRFLYWALRIVPLDTEGDLAVKGKTLNKGKISRIRIPLPPLHEQRRIVARIEELTERIDEARRLRGTAVNETERLMEAASAKVFQRAEEEGYDVYPLREMIEVSGGGTPSKKVAGYWNGTIPWVSPKDMKAHVIENTVDCITKEGAENSAVNLIKQGSVLVVFRSGILAHTVPVAINAVDVTINQDMKALIPNSSLLPEYLLWWLKGNQRTILANCVKRGATVHSIEGSRFFDMMIPIPEISTQRHIIQYLESVQAKENQLRSLQEKTHVELDSLSQAILAKAFRGEL